MGLVSHQKILILIFPIRLHHRIKYFFFWKGSAQVPSLHKLKFLPFYYMSCNGLFFSIFVFSRVNRKYVHYKFLDTTTAEHLFVFALLAFSLHLWRIIFQPVQECASSFFQANPVSSILGNSSLKQKFIQIFDILCCEFNFIQPQSVHHNRCLLKLIKNFQQLPFATWEGNKVVLLLTFPNNDEYIFTVVA